MTLVILKIIFQFKDVILFQKQFPGGFSQKKQPPGVNLKHP